MRMPTEWLGESAQNRMTDPGAQATAPIALWAAMSALAGGQDPDLHMCRMDSSDNETEWRAIWLVQDSVIYAAITKNTERWTAYSKDDQPHDMQPDTVVSWARPISDVTSVALANVEVTHSRGVGGEKEWAWSATAELTFRDGIAVSVPPFGKSDSSESDLEVQEFLNAVSARR